MTETLFDFGDEADTPETEASPTAAPPEPTNRTPDGLFDFGDTAEPAPVAGPRREITDPRGGPRINQPPPRQWSVLGTPLPGTQAAAQGEEIHPLSRAVLQNFDLTADISGNSAALKKIVSGVYGPNYDANRAASIPVADLTDDQLAKLIDQPRVERALRLDSITRRRMAEDAEEAAILRGVIPIMLAGEGQVDTMLRMMRPEAMRTPEAIAAQDANVFEGIVNIGTLGALESVYGARLKGAAGAAARAQAARTTPLDTFTSTFMQTAFPGGITANTYIPAVWTPLDLVAGFTDAVSEVTRIFAAGGFNEETANLLEQESLEEGRAVIKLLQKATAEYPSGRMGSRFMRGVQEAESDFAIFRLAAEDPAGAAAAVAEVFARNIPVLAASAGATYLGGPRAGMTVSTLAQFEIEALRPDQQRFDFLKKKTGIDISTPLGMQLFLQDPDAQRIYEAYGRARGAGIAGVQLLTLGYLRGGSFFNHRYLTGQLSERVIFNAISEGAGEGLAGLWADKFDLREVVIESAMGFAQGIPNTTIEAYVSGASDLRHVRDANNAEKWLSGVADLKGEIAGIPVAKLDTAASVMGEKLESEGIDTVYISAGPLFEQGAETARTLGLNPEDVARLAAEGGTVEVTAATFVRHILGKDGFDALIEHTMFDPAGMTPAEASEYSAAGIGDQIQQQLEERARNNLAPGLDEVSLTKLTTDITTIQDQVAGQLEATGRYDADKSRLFGLLTAQRYATRAIRMTEETGQPVDAAALFEADNLQIAGGQPAAASLEQGRIRSVWDTIRGKDSSSSVVTLRHGGPPLEGGKLDLEFTGRANDPTSTSPRETTGVYFSTEGGTQATQFSSNRRGSRVRRLYEARLPAESLSGVVDFMSRVSDLSPEMQQTLADLAAEAGIEIGRGEIAGNLISSIRNELENGTELLVEAGISGHEKKLINEMVIWDQALLDSAELFDVTEGDPVQLRQDDIEEVGNFSLKEDAKGFATVYGDVEDIRAALPDGIRGTVVPGGLRFTPNFAPRVAAALRGDETAFSRAGKVVQARKNKAGKYIGASAANNTAAKRTAWRKQFNQLALEGESGRFWYENSGAAVLELTGGDIAEAKKFIALLAIYSPQAKVSANSTFALRAWAQYKAGDPISVKTGVQDGQASAVLYDGTPWKGEKTNNFYINLLRQVDLSVAGKQGATIDMWMMHAGGYNKDYSNSSEYAFMENETNYLANELGWEPQQVQAAVWVAIKARMENPEVKRRTEEISAKRGWIHYEQNAKGKSVRVVDDERKHFGNWFKQGMAHDVTTDDTKTAKFDFADGIARHTGQISWEARPSTSVPILEGVHDAPYEQQLELQLAIMEALSDADGADRLAQYLGILADGSIVAPGVWEGDISPSAQATVAMAPAAGGFLYASKSDSDAAPLTKAEYDALSKADRANYQKTPAIDLSQQKTLKLYTSVLGLLLRQDGVGYHKPFLGASITASNGMEFLTGQSLTPAEAQLFNDTFDLRMQEAGFAGWEYNVGLISSAEGMRVVSFATDDYYLKDAKKRKENPEAITKKAYDRLPAKEQAAYVNEFIPNKKLHAIADAAFTEISGSDSIRVEYFATDGGLAFNDWKENPDGQDYIAEIKDSGRPDVLGWAGDVLYPEIQKVYADFSGRYGWGAAGQLDFFERGEHRQPAAFEQQRGAAGPRGGFTPSDLITDQDGNPVNLLQIFEKADPTTFLHESGHFWLEQLKADALAVGGGFQQDFKAVTDWWASRPLELREEAVRRAKKKKDKDSVAALQQMTEAQVSAYARSGELRGEGPSRYLSVAMHEQFARGVENYFATGRAPSLSLAAAFSQFKLWVMSIYTKLAGAQLDVQFSPQVTAVIDRMLAADEEIALIEGQYNLAAMYSTAEQAGMTPTQFAAYQKKIAEAKDDRRARQLAKHVKELKRGRTAWWKEERETLRDETSQEVAAEPAYRLLYALTNQGLADGSTLPEGEALDRMDRGLLKELLEADGFSLDDIPRIGSKAVYEADGLAPGVVAQAFGYEDVDSMILDLVGRQPYAQAVDAAIDAKMEEEHGSIEGSGEAEALASAYSERTAQVLAAELAALRTTEPAFKQAFVRAYARDRLLEMPSAQVRPYRFLATEKRHANLAGDALKRGDKVAAYQHQFQRLVNHYMATEALKAQRDIEKKTRYMRKFTKAGQKFPRIEAAYVDNILRILAAVNFGQGAAGQQSRANEIIALQQFIVERQEADGSILDVPDWLVNPTGNAANTVREMSYLQFLNLHETIKRYEQQGRAANKVRRGDEEVSRTETKAELLAVLDGMEQSRVQRLRGKAASPEGLRLDDRIKYIVASGAALFDAQLLKVEALLEAIDGRPLGAWQQTIYEPFNKAAADKYLLQEEVSKLVGELIDSLPKEVRRSFGKQVDVGALGKPGMRFTRGNLIMMALNVGNESNLDKFIRGMGGDPESNVKGAGWNINEELVDAALDNLTEEEWNLVRGVWAHAEKLYPTVEGIYRREHGISPDRLEPRTVKTKFGEIKGGYFPMMYDRTIAGVAVDLQQKTALELMQAETGRASINSSMTKGRTGYAAPVDLDISRMSIGLDNTIHFITHYEAVRNANKILGDRDVRAELENKVGIAYTDQLAKWVAALAANGNDSPPVDILQKSIQKLYTNTTVAVLGFSYSTLGMQTLGLFNGQDRLLADSGYGPVALALVQKDIAAGVAAAFRPAHVAFVLASSGEMQGRRKSMDREVSNVLRGLAGKEGVVSGAQRFSMQAIAEVQFYTVDIPVWTAGYNRALRGNVGGVDKGDTAAAIKYADRVVRLSQSAGGLKDLAAVQRHKGLVKGLTMFYSFFSALYAVLRATGVEFSQNVKDTPIASTSRAATRLFVLLALQSVATGLIRGDLPDWEEEDKEKEDMLDYIAKESLVTALGVIPVIRDIAAGVASGYGYSGGAGNIAFEALSKSMSGLEKIVDEFGNEEVIKTDGDYEDMARRYAPFILLFGAVTGTPAVQLNRTLDGLAAFYDEADDWSPTDLLRGYKPERAKRRAD